MSEKFSFDVFLSHSSKDKDIIRPLAERLKGNGVRVWLDEWEIRPGDSIPAKIEDGLERSRVLVLCMSANAFASDWAQLEAGTFRFRDPLNRDRRFIPLRLDDTPIKGTLGQFSYIDWLVPDKRSEYAKLLEACRPLTKDKELKQLAGHVKAVPSSKVQCKDDLSLHVTEKRFSACAFDSDKARLLTASKDGSMSLWDVATGKCKQKFQGHKSQVASIAWSNDEKYALTASRDETIRLWDIESSETLKVFRGHTRWLTVVVWSRDQRKALSAGGDKTIRLWDVYTGNCLQVMHGHTGNVRSLLLSADNSYVLSGADDNTLRLWNLASGKCEQVYEGHTDWVLGAIWNGNNEQQFLSYSRDKTIRLWDAISRRCLSVFEGHTKEIKSASLTDNKRLLVTASFDKTVRLWDIKNGLCLYVAVGHRAWVRSVAWCNDQQFCLSVDHHGVIRQWDFSSFVDKDAREGAASLSPQTHIAVRYTNAKVLLVGETSSGKTGLAHRLATGKWQSTVGSTVGAWSTQWPLPGVNATKELDREIWLWDFGGQADQRLVHQLYMDRTTMILLLFDADKEDVLPGLRDWQTALRRCVPSNTPLLLVAGRIDAGFRASREKLKRFADEQGFKYFETSAKDGTGCNELVNAIIQGIPWDELEQRTSPRIFKLIKDHILKLRDAGQVLHTYKELRDLLWQGMAGEQRFSDDTLKTVIGLLDGPGVVKELEYGTYILLQPEWINVYAQAVIRTLRQEPSELGCIPLRSIAEGKLLFQTVERDGSILEMKRLPAADERVVLREMERQMEERGLCLRQGDKLVFPSHCGRERPAVVAHPSVFVSYTVKGYLDDIYATLVTKLADSNSFKLSELWRDAADFDTLAGACRMGIKLVRNSAGAGEIIVYFGSGVPQGEQVIFSNYIHAHLIGCCEKVQRQRHYVCPHCNTPKGNSQVLMEKLLVKKHLADTECDKCGERFVLWDALEQQFADDKVRELVEGLKTGDVIRLDARRKGKLLTLEVMARISSADQKCFEIPATEDEGLDVELEFTEDGKGTGRRLYLQLKSGNSYLRTLKDGTEVFDIKEQRWVDYWLKQPHPVMLVIGTFSQEDEPFDAKEKLEFLDVRWMEISSELRRLSEEGTKSVKRIHFKGERMDMSSIYRWRARMLEK